MVPVMSRDAAVAANRFGLGARPGEIVAAAHDPRGWLHAQIERLAPVPDTLKAAAPDPATALETTFIQQRTQPDPNPVQLAYRGFVAELMEWLATTDTPFLERWALFWANHLTVSLRGGNPGALVGDYYLNTIRANCLGKFEDMVLASARHPAMLRYLDNAQSMGPNSFLGQRSRRGLNENYARELMELHTISPAGGYAQADVTQLARVLTGWSAGNPGPAPFVFRVPMHEPGDKQVMGRTFTEGEAAGEEAIRWLATRPATWRHLATKLARHFVADDPPPAAIAAIEKRLADTGGDLKASAKAVVALPDAWGKAQSKLRTPLEFVVASFRATGNPLPPPNRLGALNILGQPMFLAPAPNGWPDRAENWAGPEAMLRRIEWAGTLVRRIADPPDPRAVLEATLGPLADQHTRFNVSNAETSRDGLVVLLGSPAFQRR
jgi:uncharacterized protein (DUF1800 family)